MINKNEDNFHASEIICKMPQDADKTLIDKYGTFIFMAYGCALVERQTPAGVYIYTAVNLETGKMEILSRRNGQLKKTAFDSMAEKIRASSVCGVRRLNIDNKADKSIKSSRLSEVLNYTFTKILPQYGYAVRENQVKLAEHIFSVIGQRGVTLAESEVGTGKTHAYVIAAVIAKRGRLNDSWVRGHYPRQGWAESANMPVVISTSSIALQKAIVSDYIPEVSQILMRHGVIRTPLTAAIRKGKEHYICEQRLQRYYKNADTFTKKQLEPFMGKTAPFDLTDVDKLSPYIKRNICVSGRCSDNCPRYGKCRYLRHHREINDPKIDFQITNHNYFIADTMHRAGCKRPLLPNYQLLIIDEAHKFLQAARSMYGMELTSDELPALARKIHTFTLDKSKSGVNVHRLAKKLEEQGEKLFKRLNDNIPENDFDDDAERFPAIIDSDASHLLKNITGILSDLAAAIADSPVQKLYRERRSKAIWRLNILSDRTAALRKQHNLICWLEKRVEGETETDAICSIPKNLNERLCNDLWSSGIPMVLTSGTLSASGDFTRAKETLGLNLIPSRRLFDTTMPSPFDYKNNVLLYISEKTPFPDYKDKNYITAIADEIERLVIASHGHAAVLFTSYNAMGQVHSILEERKLPFPLFRLERGGVQAIERFKKSGNGILFASGALWEGIDIPGDTLSLLIIVKLPFAVPDPIGDYERSLCGSMEIYKNRAIIPDMQVREKQGFGRLIRCETDTGVCAIIDSRANSAGAYRRYSIVALPVCRVTSSVAAVKTFMLEKKIPAYFQ